MWNKQPSMIDHSTAEVVAQVREDDVVGIFCPVSLCLEAIHVGGTENGMVGFHWLTGAQRGKGEIVPAHTFEARRLPAKLRAKALRIDRENQRARGERPCPVPACPRGVDASAWLVMNNCD